MSRAKKTMWVVEPHAFHRFFGGLKGKPKGKRAPFWGLGVPLLWVDEIHFAAPKKPWNDSIPL